MNGGGGIYNSSSSWPKVRNSIFSGNKKGNSTSVRGADIENNGTTTKVTLGNSLVQNLNSASFYPLTDTSGFLGGGKSNYYNIDPKFVNAADPDGIDNIFGTIDDGLRLQNCSPAVNTGDNNNITATDISGLNRLSSNNTYVDMGAFENQDLVTPVQISLIAPSGAFCYKTSVTFTAATIPINTPGDFTFMVNGEIRRASSTSKTFTIDSLENGDRISVFFEGADCNSSGYSDFHAVEVYDLPRPVVIGDTVCKDSDINLFASNSNSASGNIYEWTGPAFQPSSAAQNPVISNSLVSYSGKYYVTITNANSCVKNDSVNVLVRPLPILTISGGSTFCEDQVSPDLSITLQGSGPWDFSYSDGTDTTNVSNRSTSPYTITRAPAGSYTVISANDIYCNASAATLIGTADVIINPIPPVPVITEPAEKIVCFENTLTLEVTNCTGTVTWYNNNIETTTTANPLILDSVGTYSLSAKCSALGCVSEVSGLTADLEIKTKPAAPVLQIVSAAIVCSPDSLLFSGSCSLGNLIWLDNSSTVANRKIKAVGVYSISAICSFNDCISNESTLTSLTIKEKPSAPVISVPNEIVVCDPTTITLNSGCATGNILWNNVDSNTDLVLSGTGVYSAYSVCTLNGCVSDTTNNTGFEIKEKPAAPVLVIPATLIVCEPDSIIIKGSCAAGSTILWNNASTLDSVILKIADTYAIDATCVKNGCSSDASATVNAEIKSSGLPSITSNSPICQGASLNLSSSLADIYGWSGPTGILDSAQSITVVDAQAGMYYLTVTYANGCSRNDSTEVSFNAILTPPTISVPAQLVVCAPNTITLVASCTTGTVKWSDNVTAPATRVFSTPGTYTGISATCTLNECYSDPTNASNLEIKAAADFTVAHNGPICTGAVLNLTSSLAGETYHWTGPSSFESFVQNPTSIPPVAGTYVLTVTYTNACTLTKSTQVTVKPKPSSPNVNIPASKITCEPNTISFSATCPAGTLKWIDNSTSPIIKLDTVNTYTISAICIFNGCPSNNSTNTVVEIKERPLTPVINPPAQSSACSPGGSLSIGATCANGSSLLWNNSTSVSPLVLSNTGSYSISALCLKNGCISPTSSPLALNIYQTPEAPVVTGPTNAVVCAPSTLQLSATCVSGTVKWSNDSTGTNLTLSAVNTYSISAKCVLNGCSSDASTPIAMEIRTAPVVSITNPASICAGATLSFTATEGASYSWQGPNGFTSNVRNPAILNAGVNRTGTYSVTVTFANSCSSSATTSVVVNSSPALSVTANPTTVESGASSTLTLSGCTGGAINWAINNSAVNPLTIAIFNTTDFSVSCVKNGCTSVISKKVTVSNPCESLLVLESLIDNISSSAGVLLKQASTNGGKIEASNKITGTAKVNYEAPSIELKSGFVSESGTVFTAQPGGCN